MATRNDVLKKFHPIILLCTLFSYIIRSNKMMARLIQMECNSYKVDVHIYTHTYIRKNSENPSKQANKQIQALALQTFPSEIASGCRRFAIVCSLMCSYGVRRFGTAVHCTVPYCMYNVHIQARSTPNSFSTPFICYTQPHFDWLCCDCHSNFMVFVHSTNG